MKECLKIKIIQRLIKDGRTDRRRRQSWRLQCNRHQRRSPATLALARARRKSCMISSRSIRCAFLARGSRSCSRRFAKGTITRTVRSRWPATSSSSRTLRSTIRNCTRWKPRSTLNPSCLKRCRRWHRCLVPFAAARLLTSYRSTMAVWPRPVT